MATTLDGQVLRELSATWSAPSTLVRQGFFPQLTCTSASFCGFVGASKFTSFNGSSWSTNTLLFPSFVPDDFDFATALSCSGTALCVVADEAGNAVVGSA